MTLPTPRSRLAVAATALGVAVAASGCGEQPSGRIGAAACTQAVHDELRAVAVRVYGEAARGANLVNSVRRLERARILAAAVAQDDVAATNAALRRCCAPRSSAT